MRIVGQFILLLLIVGCAVEVHAGGWEETLAAARKEGRVAVIGPLDV